MRMESICYYHYCNFLKTIVVQVIGFANSSALDDYLLQNPQTVQAAVNFDIEASNIGYTLQTNSTVSRKSMITRLDSE